MVEIINVNQEKSSHKGFIWNNTWQVLKKWQGKNCISMKKSKGLLFRIKCINSILLTKDICFLRNPTLYKNQRCIACLRNDESLYHIAEYEIYVKIWKNLEEEALQLTGLQTITKLEFALEDKSLRNAIFGNELNSHIQNRKMLLRGLTSIKQQREVMKLTSSKKKANKVLTIFLEQF